MSAAGAPPTGEPPAGDPMKKVKVNRNKAAKVLKKAGKKFKKRVEMEGLVARFVAEEGARKYGDKFMTEFKDFVDSELKG